MGKKALAVVSDGLLVALLVGSAIWLFASGIAPAAWASDRTLFPLSVEGSRILILLTAVGIVLGLVLAWTVLPARDRVLDGEVIRYDRYQRLIHWATAVGYVVSFVTAVVLLRWLSLSTGPEYRPLLYVAHFVGAGLIVLATAMFVTSTRVQGRDALIPRWRDISPALARLFEYLGIYGHPGVLGLRWPGAWQQPCQRALAALGIKPLEREDKFLAAEKVLSFTPLAVLTVLVVATGMVKAAHYFFSLSADVLYWATWLHDLTTWLTLIVVGAHIAAIVLVPRNWPGIRAMLTGRIKRAVVEEEFPEWDERLRGQMPEPAEQAPRPGVVYR